jgi:hypothetical protein
LVAGDGTAAASVQGKIQSHSNVAKKGGGGGDVDEDVERRRVSAQARSRLAAELLLCPSVRRRSARGKGAEEEEGTVGGG